MNDHGEPSASVVFYVWEERSAAVSVTAKWLSDDGVAIRYDVRMGTVGRMIRRVGPVNIKYTTVGNANVSK